MAAKWQTTIGYERRHNPALQIGDRAAFVRSLTTDMPPAPDHFARCSDINRRGPVLLENLPPLQELEPGAFFARLAEPETAVLDVRNYSAYAGQHIRGAWHIDLNGNFPTFAGWVLPTDLDLLLVADGLEEAARAGLWARRVGVDRIVGFLAGGMAAWASSGSETAGIRLISAPDLHAQAGGEMEIVLLDVRAPLEYADEHIAGTVNIPAPELRVRHAELDPLKPTVVVCSSGNRSSLAASILEQQGFTQLSNLAGGMTGYRAAGFARHCAACINPHGPRAESEEPHAAMKS